MTIYIVSAVPIHPAERVPLASQWSHAVSWHSKLEDAEQAALTLDTDMGYYNHAAIEEYEEGSSMVVGWDQDHKGQRWFKRSEDNKMAPCDCPAEYSHIVNLALG